MGFNIDEIFKKYGEKYGIPWALLKAQGVIESGLKPDSISSKGAIGIMQIMPATYDEIKKKLNHLKDIYDPESNIEAGAFYLSSLIRQTEKLNPHPKEIIPLALASYNWGIGNIKRLIKKLKTTSWMKLLDHLPEETKNYVKKVLFLYLKYSGKLL
ncbi:MAG: lytic transglycosylase domain-containing protein [bacterium]